MIRVLAVLLCLAAAPAHALSCLRPSVEGSFATAHAAPQLYVVGLGRVVLGEGAAPPAPFGPDRGAVVTELPAMFSGRIGGRDGFGAAIDLPVTLRLTCAAHWCGAAPEGEVLTFIEIADTGHRITEGPCPQAILRAEPDTEARAAACLSDPGRCAP